MKRSFTRTMLEKFANRYEYTVCFEKHSSVFGYMKFKNNERHYVSYNDLGINNYVPVRIARHKWTCLQMLKEAGFLVPESLQVFNKEYIDNDDYSYDQQSEKINDFVQEKGSPFFLKPAEGSQGQGVKKITHLVELEELIRTGLQTERELIIEKAVSGIEIRLVIYDGKLFMAYSKQPRIGKNGKHSHLGNLSDGATATVCTNEIHTQYINQAVRALRVLNLTYAAIDVMIPGNYSEPANSMTILEVNTNPGYHYFLQQHPVEKKSIEILFELIIYDIAKVKNNKSL